MIGIEVRVRGVVQGVGFRPFVANLAEDLHIKGQVWNDAEGVLIQAWADKSVLDIFVQSIQDSAPPLAKIQYIESVVLDKVCHLKGFEIITSIQGKTATGVAADAATCAECLADVQNQEDRHYQYPFTNCTHCGPRLSIIREVPYDRANTSMSAFAMCDACLAEYQNPKDRRFHAQPNACPDCGPQLLWLDKTGEVLDVEDALDEAARQIKQGLVVAIKGIGGIHLACDATHEHAVNMLRQRKRRFDKPFALMAKDIGQIHQYAHITADDTAALIGVAAPVVVLQAKEDSTIADSVSPHQSTLGFMLPYTPLHHLLMQKLDHSIVLTSGNVSDEPQCIDNDDAVARLSGIADGFLLHNRDIVNRLDDSVLKVMADAPRILRRARGFSPSALVLPQGFENAHGVLAMGGELKNTFCLLQYGQAIMSQHMGDLENVAVHEDYQKNLALYQQLYDFTPTHIAVDKHQDYFSTQWGTYLAEEQGLKLTQVQHHHAHIVACMAEHGLPLGSEVLGIALDGLGMGEDGTFWGGEFLHVSYASFKRLGSIQEAPMLGGSQAMKEPWRNAFAQLQALGWDKVAHDFSALPLIQKLGQKPVANLQVMCNKGLNSPQASSTGRLFDAVAAALDICFEKVSFEGQAAMALEVLAEQRLSLKTEVYPVEIKVLDGVWRILWKPMWLALLNDLKANVLATDIAAKFHQTVIYAASKQAVKLACAKKCSQVVLSGGVFQNRLLLEGVQQQLQTQGFDVLIPRDYPMNDGGLALGQAVIALAKSKT
ncbi:carbamoyltransferase HypF [Ghiorsea bivora]|uniref:carbamoyltransferase HypF n=1 Tax=Ghiorsea bivora TaxID=1485545 RepID=UPI00056E9F28|nr:carbamoyltransferase HypF [Ghiorsea bivora]